MKTSEKLSERSHINDFIEEFNRYSADTAVFKERLAPPCPDYLAEVDGVAVGIELTELPIVDKKTTNHNFAIITFSKEVHALLKGWPDENKVVIRLNAILHAIPSKSNAAKRSSLAQKVASFIRTEVSNMKLGDSQVFQKKDIPDEIGFFDSIFLSIRSAGSPLAVVVPGGYYAFWVEGRQKQIQEVIIGKEKDDYNKCARCKKKWLLIRDRDPFFTANEDNSETYSSSMFERVYLQGEYSSEISGYPLVRLV